MFDNGDAIAGREYEWCISLSMPVQNWTGHMLNSLEGDIFMKGEMWQGRD